MTKTEMLFIRACKSTDSSKRILSVYRRFYGKYEPEESLSAVVHILSNIVDKVNKPSLLEVIASLNMYQYIYSNVPKTYVGYMQITLLLLINRLRFIEVSKLPEDFIKPIIFRREDEAKT
jgi:hypothetical protein